MSYDKYGQQYLTEDELVEMLHINPELDIAKVLLEDPTTFNRSNSELYAGFPMPRAYLEPTGTVEEFDKTNQSVWHMPRKCKEFDIVSWLVEQCETNEQIERVAMELNLYDKRSLIPLLKFLKYMIDTFRENNIVWGVGRGSSVASYVLYLMGVHKIDSMKYELDVTEFLRDV